MTFHYLALLESDESDRVINVAACQTFADGILQAVLWSFRHGSWIFGPGVIAYFLYDGFLPDRTLPIDRATAEMIAHEVLNERLPSEPDLAILMEEGHRLGWDFGPPTAD